MLRFSSKFIFFIFVFVFNFLIKSGLLNLKNIDAEVRMEYPAVFSWYHPQSINHVAGAIWVSKQNIQKFIFFCTFIFRLSVDLNLKLQYLSKMFKMWSNILFIAKYLNIETYPLVFNYFLWKKDII